jgi:myo-inositol-1(or 4)-monophosphatase
MNLNLNELTQNVLQISKQVGLFIQKERNMFDLNKVEIKGLNDLVSYVDKTSEKMLIERLASLIPESVFLAEESSIDNPTKNHSNKYTWIIDPLDGTTNFVHGIPCYAISIGLEFQNEIILGVVYEIAKDECFYAYKNGGSFLNGKLIKVSNSKSINNSLFATGFPVNNFEKIPSYLKTLEYLIQNSHGIRRIGAASVDLCYLACGRFDAFFEYNLKPWDVAGASIIVKEAGGSICDFNGGDNWLYGKEMIATNNQIKTEFEKLIKENFK